MPIGMASLTAGAHGHHTSPLVTFGLILIACRGGSKGALGHRSARSSCASTSMMLSQRCRSFDTKDGETQTVDLPFSEFIPVFRAKTLQDGTRLTPSSVFSIQLMLSKCGVLFETFASVIAVIWGSLA